MTTTKTLTCMALLTFLFSLPAQAQHTRVAPEADAQQVRVSPELEAPFAWRVFVGRQLAGSLQSPVAEIRHNALQLITYLATYGHEAVDLSETIPVLLSIYRTDPDERCRLAAVAGLHALGDEDAMRRLRQEIHHQPSRRVQLATLGALMAFYGPVTFEDDVEAARLAEAVRAYVDTVNVTKPVVASDQ